MKPIYTTKTTSSQDVDKSLLNSLKASPSNLSKTPFTLGQMIPDSSLIRNVLTSDSFYGLH